MKRYFRNMSFTSSRSAVRLAVAAKALSFFGDQVAAVALMLRLQSAGAGPGAVAALLMAALAPIALLSGPAGRLADRYGSRPLLATSGTAQCVVCSALVFASGPAATLALVALLGVGQAVNGATWSGLLPSLVPAAELARVTGRVQAANTLGLVAAPAVAGLLTALAGTRPAIALDAATFAAVAAAGWCLPERRAARVSGRVPGGWRIVARDALLRTAVGGLGLLVLLASMVNVVDVFLVRRTLGAGPLWYGIAGATYAVGVFAGALVGGRLAGDRALARGLAASAALMGAGLAAMGLAPSVVALAAVAAGTGAANGVFNVASSALIFGRAAPDQRGRVGAVVGGVASGAQLLAYTTGGALAGAPGGLSPREVFVLSGLLAVLGAVALARPLRRAVGRGAGVGPSASAGLSPTDDQLARSHTGMWFRAS